MVQDAKLAREVFSEAIRFFESWIVFRRPSDAVVCALWTFNTWVYEVFDSTPYLCISAATKQAGKTALLETVAALSRNAEVLTDPHAANLYRLADQEEYGGRISFFIDEAEKLNRENNDARPYFNTGYRKGATVPRTMPGGKTIKFPCFCPKAFALIGDVYDTLRDRCIVVRLVRSATPKRFRPTLMHQEARELVFKIRRVMEPLQAGMAWADDSLLSHLNGRDEEVWLPIMSLAVALGFTPKELDKLRAASADSVAEKTDEARSYIELRAAAEAEAIGDSYGERALADLRSVLRDGEPAIFSAVAVERMKEIPTGPWRTFKGVGLTVDALAGLVDRFGLNPSPVRMERGRGAKQLRGYGIKEIERALATLGEGGGK